MSDGMDTLGPIARLPKPPESSPLVHAPMERAVPLSREQILDATDQCLVQHGYDGLTIRRIAATMQCAVGSIYRYFEDKRQLLEAVTQRRLEDVTARAEAGAPIDATALAYAQLATEDGQTYRLMFWLGSMQRGATTQAETMPAVVRRLIAAWSRQLGDENRAQRLWSFVHGAIMLGRDPQRAMRDAEMLMVRKAMSGSDKPSIHITMKQPLATAG